MSKKAQKMEVDVGPVFRKQIWQALCSIHPGEANHIVTNILEAISVKSDKRIMMDQRTAIILTALADIGRQVLPASRTLNFDDELIEAATENKKNQRRL